MGTKGGVTGETVNTEHGNSLNTAGDKQEGKLKGDQVYEPCIRSFPEN